MRSTPKNTLPHQKPTLLVLAAGMGSRYGGLKQMDPMGPNGETVLDYSVFDAIRAGFGKIVFVIREDFADNFKVKIGNRFADKIKVAYAYQKLDDLPEGFSLPEGRTKPWGTAHAILSARKLIDTPFAVINADDFYGKDSYLQFAQYFVNHLTAHANTDQYCMIGYPLQNTLSQNGSVNRGICSIHNNFLNTVEEHVEIKTEDNGICAGKNLAGNKVELPLNSLTSMNFWGFPASIMLDLEAHFIEFLKKDGNAMKSECYIPTVVDQMISTGKANCKVLTTSSTWFGVTYPEDKAHCIKSLKELIRIGEYPENLWT